MPFLSTWMRRCAVTIKSSAGKFIQDLTDQSANKISNPNWAVDGLTTIGIALLAASGQAEAVQKLVSQMSGDFSNVIQLILLLGAEFWCAAVISAKTKSKQLAGIASKLSSTNVHIYLYSQPLRGAAKIGFLLLAVAVPSKLRTILDEVFPLPTTIYGYMFYDTTKPVDGANIRVVSSDDSDVTIGSWLTDSKGFYIVKAVRRIRRSDVLKVKPDGCTTEVSLPLKRPNEHSTEGSQSALSPLFMHVIHCEGSK
jgi:hypothetical protein